MKRGCPFGRKVQVGDRFGRCYKAMQEYGVMLTGFDTLQPADDGIVAAAHKEHVDAGWQGHPVFVD